MSQPPSAAGFPAPGAYPGPGAYQGQPGQPAPLAPEIPAPYSGQPSASGYTSPGQYQAPQSTAAPHGVLACRFCGSIPAAQAKFRGHQGMLIVMRFLSNEGPFCRDCGLGVFRHMTSRTLVQGWYGYASFIITPFTVLMNLFRRGKVANLPAPQPNPYAPSRPPMDPGPGLMERPLTWLGLLIPVAVVGLIVFAATHN